MRKIVEYKTIWKRADEIDEIINEYIKCGFQPYGFPIHEVEGHIIQAMVKYEGESTRCEEGK